MPGRLSARFFFMPRNHVEEAIGKGEHEDRGEQEVDERRLAVGAEFLYGKPSGRQNR